ncbi:hypothetical protein [Neomicrococcus lactis]|uniref:PepSY domain-containing protein n=1 Tax=Neomicrococcus lactis TaxID=732241 RepID=A0A7W8YC11_9MICC|nr:hypothetical protein [Neomicrococcus lactis]MBB5598682.1 hypothetical protein [Neomicrococcus lactis]
MNARKIALGAAGLATVAAAVAGGVGSSLANAAGGATGLASNPAFSSLNGTSVDAVAAESSTGSSSDSSTDSSQKDALGGPGGAGGMMHNHTEVTGDEATKVTDAVQAKDSSFTAEKVLKDEDGSYDVIGKSGDTFVKYEVSSDLKTITKDEHVPGEGGPGRGGPGGGPGMNHEEVTGDDATKVSDAVKAKDSAVTVEKIFKNEDGSYMVAGTKDDERVMFKVSSDLGTVEKLERPAKGDRMRHGMGGMNDDDDSSDSNSNGTDSDDSGSSNPSTDSSFGSNSADTSSTTGA